MAWIRNCASPSLVRGGAGAGLVCASVVVAGAAVVETVAGEGPGDAGAGTKRAVGDGEGGEGEGGADGEGRGRGAGGDGDDAGGDGDGDCSAGACPEVDNSAGSGAELVEAVVDVPSSDPEVTLPIFESESEAGLGVVNSSGVPVVDGLATTSTSFTSMVRTATFLPDCASLA